METKTKSVLQVMKALTWIVFIGLCIKVGAMLFSFFVSLFVNPEAAKDLYLGLNLSELFNFSKLHYVNMFILVIISPILKAYLFFLLIKVFSTINLKHPFSSTIRLLLSNISLVALSIGMSSVIAVSYYGWLYKKGMLLYSLPRHISGSSEFLFFAGIIFIISLIFKRGIEMQSENDLTV